MKKKLSPRKSLSACQQLDKDNKSITELQAVQTYLANNIATASMVAIDLCIYRPNLSRYKRTLEKYNHLVQLDKRTCKATGFKAHYLSCNPTVIIAVKEGRSHDC
jgi:hypothetical protein